jgi:hypothetical protein
VLVLSRLSVKSLDIDKDMHSIIDKLTPNLNNSSSENPPRFSLKVHYGQKLESWIEQVSLLDSE